MNYHTRWMEQLATQSRVGLALALLAVAAILVVRYAPDRARFPLLVVAGLVYTGLGVLIAGGVLHLTGPWMMTAPPWYDEIFTALIARLPIDRMMTAIAGDVHPPLWYLIEAAAIRLGGGDSVVLLRLPALGFGLLALWLSYRLALALGLGREVAALSIILLALMPGQWYYAQEARMYTLLECAVLLAALGISTRRPWMMAAGMTITLYTHNLGAVYVAILAGLYIWTEGILSVCDLMRGEIRFPAMALQMLRDGLRPLGAIMLAWSPWLAVMLSQANHVGSGFWLPAYNLGGYLSEAARIFLMGAPPALAVNLTLLWVGLWALAVKSPSPQRTFIVALGGGAPLAMALASALWTPIYLHRALLPTLPILAIGAAATLVRMRRDAANVILMLTIITLICGLTGMTKSAGEMTARMAEAIRPHCNSAVVVWHANLASYIGLSYYLPECDHAVWPDAGNLAQALTKQTQRAMGIRRAEAAAVRSDLLIVSVENPMTTPAEAAALAAALSLGRPAWVMTEEHELMRVRAWRVDRKITNEEEIVK